MDEKLKARELLSALADGELKGEELVRALALCQHDSACVSWEAYHLIGDVLRSPELACASDSERFLAGFRGELARTPLAHAAPTGLVPAEAEAFVAPRAVAANGALWRWKMAAGFASLAAVAAIGWNSLGMLQGEAPQAAQLAAAAPAGQAAVPPQAEFAQAGAQVMIRDPRLDELLAAHKQFGGASALQMPAGFLRNATFEAPQR